MQYRSIEYRTLTPVTPPFRFRYRANASIANSVQSEVVTMDVVDLGCVRLKRRLGKMLRECVSRVSCAIHLKHAQQLVRGFVSCDA